MYNLFRTRLNRFLLLEDRQFLLLSLRRRYHLYSLVLSEILKLDNYISQNLLQEIGHYICNNIHKIILNMYLPISLKKMSISIVSSNFLK